MPTFEAAEQAKDDPLRLPIPGRDGRLTVYEIPVLDAAGLVELAQLERSVRMITVGLGDRIPDDEVAKLDKMTQRQHVELVLSPGTFRLMCDNGIDQRMLTAAAITAQCWHTRGTQAAFDAWQLLAVHPGVDEADPKAQMSGGRSTSPRTGSSSTSRKRRSKGKARAGR